MSTYRSSCIGRLCGQSGTLAAMWSNVSVGNVFQVQQPVYGIKTNFWLCCVFVAVCRLSLVAAWWGLPSVMAGLWLQWLLLLKSTGSVVVAQVLSCPMAYLPEPGLNPSPLHWQVDSNPGLPGKSWQMDFPFWDVFHSCAGVIHASSCLVTSHCTPPRGLF